MQNWAGNVTYSAARILRPTSVGEAQELISNLDSVSPLGTRHSFSLVADTTGTLVSTESLDRVVEIGATTVTVEAGIRYGVLSAILREHGLALASLASLPHISVGGAISTATHGSGVRNQSLAAAVASLELVCSDGSVRVLRRGDEQFAGAVVGIGALGLVTHVELDVLPEFALRQYVFEELPWSEVESSLDAILAAAYSVSLFTSWTELGIDQVWVKTTEEIVAGSPFFGATAALRARNPVPGASPENCTQQLGVPGASGERLPHFRLGFTPSGGDELQTEYVVAKENAVEVIRALRALSARIAPLLLVSEIRAVAADDLWLSPFYERDGVAFHFTWKPRSTDVLALLPSIEAALAPFSFRPHWGKLFVTAPAYLEAAYPRLLDFRRLCQELDKRGAYRNAFVDRLVFQSGM